MPDATTAAKFAGLQGVPLVATSNCPSPWSCLHQGDPGDLFYIIKEGEAVVYQESGGSRKRVNQLFKADFFGEGALLSDEPRHVCARALLCDAQRMTDCMVPTR